MAAHRYTGMKATAAGMAIGATILASSWFYVNQPASAANTSGASTGSSANAVVASQPADNPVVTGSAAAATAATTIAAKTTATATAAAKATATAAKATTAKASKGS